MLLPKLKTRHISFRRTDQLYANLKTYAQAISLFFMLFLSIEFLVMSTFDAYKYVKPFSCIGFCVWHALLTSVVTSIIIALGICFKQTRSIPMIKAFKVR